MSILSVNCGPRSTSLMTDSGDITRGSNPSLIISLVSSSTASQVSAVFSVSIPTCDRCVKASISRECCKQRATCCHFVELYRALRMNNFAKTPHWSPERQVKMWKEYVSLIIWAMWLLSSRCFQLDPQLVEWTNALWSLFMNWFNLGMLTINRLLINCWLRI